MVHDDAYKIIKEEFGFDLEHSTNGSDAMFEIITMLTSNIKILETRIGFHGGVLNRLFAKIEKLEGK